VAAQLPRLSVVVNSEKSTIGPQSISSQSARNASWAFNFSRVSGRTGLLAMIPCHSYGYSGSLIALAHSVL
jgi:hypothetical protein